GFGQLGVGVGGGAVGGGPGPGGEGQPMKDAKPEFALSQFFEVTVLDSDPARLRDAVNKVVQAALKAGATNGGVTQSTSQFGPGGNYAQAHGNPYVQFFSQDEAALRQKALGKAVQAGLANARAMAEGANVKIKSTVTVSDTFENYFPFQTSGSDADVQGEIEYRVQVRVTCGF